MFSVISVARHRIISVCNTYYPCNKRYILALYSIWITFSVIPFVMIKCPDRYILYALYPFKYFPAYSRMSLYCFILFVCKLRRLCQNIMGYSYLSYIMQKTYIVNISDFRLIPSKLYCYVFFI